MRKRSTSKISCAGCSFSLLLAGSDYATPQARLRTHFERAISILKKSLGPRNSAVAVCMNNFGLLLLLAKQDLEEAQRNFREALSIFKSSYGVDHQLTKSSASNLKHTILAASSASATFGQTSLVLAPAYHAQHLTEGAKVGVDKGDLLRRLRELDSEQSRRLIEALKSRKPEAGRSPTFRPADSSPEQKEKGSVHRESKRSEEGYMEAAELEAERSQDLDADNEEKDTSEPTGDEDDNVSPPDASESLEARSTADLNQQASVSPLAAEIGHPKRKKSAVRTFIDWATGKSDPKSNKDKDTKVKEEEKEPARKEVTKSRRMDADKKSKPAGLSAAAPTESRSSKKASVIQPQSADQAFLRKSAQPSVSAPRSLSGSSSSPPAAPAPASSLAAAPGSPPSTAPTPSMLSSPIALPGLPRPSKPISAPASSMIPPSDAATAKPARKMSSRSSSTSELATLTSAHAEPAPEAVPSGFAAPILSGPEMGDVDSSDDLLQLLEGVDDEDLASLLQATESGPASVRHLNIGGLMDM